MRHTPLEIAETQALLADVEHQIQLHEQLIAACRASGRPTQRIIHNLRELHQSADRKRDHIREMRREYDA
jgi:hypothetical protein